MNKLFAILAAIVTACVVFLEVQDRQGQPVVIPTPPIVETAPVEVEADGSIRCKPRHARQWWATVRQGGQAIHVSTLLWSECNHCPDWQALRPHRCLRAVAKWRVLAA